MRLTGKVAVVTGGGGGIGLGIASCLSQEGAKIAVLDLDLEKARNVANKVISLGNMAIALRADVTDELEVESAVRRVIDAYDKIDIFVNNAGIACKPGLPFINNSLDDWDKVWDVNVKSLHITCKAIWPHFTGRRSGRIINIASIAAPMAGQMKPPYSVAKAGVITFTHILAKEFAPYDVTVNAISPGLVWTPFWEGVAKNLIATNANYQGMTPRQAFERRMSELVPLQREQTPEDIGWAVAFFASDQARNITGQVLSVDGGVIMQ